MTTFEHAMVGITGSVAAGLHRRYGWRLVAVAGLAAICPDWDALTLLGGVGLFDRGHRVWGHNVFAAGLLGALIGALDYRLNLTGRAGLWLGRYIKVSAKPQPASPDPPPAPRQVTWIVVGALAAFSHLAADLVVSGTETLGDWELKLLWPFSDRGWVFPLMRWGDPTVSIIFSAGMLTMALRPAQARPVAAATLALVVVYLVLRRIVSNAP